MHRIALLLVTASVTLAAEDLVKTLGLIETLFFADWKTRRLNSFDDNIAPEGIAWSGFGIVEKKQMLELQKAANSGCEVRNFELSDLRVLTPDKHTAILMYRVKQDALCGGFPATSPLMNASVYAKRKGKWINVFRASQPQIAPPPASPAVP